MRKVVEDLKGELPKALTGEAFQQKQAEMKAKFAEERKALMEKLDKKAAKPAFTS